MCFKHARVEAMAGDGRADLDPVSSIYAWVDDIELLSSSLLQRIYAVYFARSRQDQNHASNWRRASIRNGTAKVLSTYRPSEGWTIIKPFVIVLSLCAGADECVIMSI